MKNKQIFITISVFLLLILTGLFFVFYSINSANTLNLDNSKAETKTLSQNSNDVKSSSSKPELNSKTISNHPNINNAKDSDKVVDQTIYSSNVVAENGLIAENKKFEIEITFFDGDQNKLLVDCEVELICHEENEKKEKFISDKNGKIHYFPVNEGDIYLRFSTKNFFDVEKNIFIKKKKNEIKILFFRSGTIEVRAINAKGNIVEGLSASFVNEDLITVPLVYDKTKSLYVIPNLQVGLQHVYFKAKGYMETPLYRINLDSKHVFTLETLLEPERLVLFDFEIPDKPKSIKIVYRELISMFERETINYESHLNKKGLYELPLNIRCITNVIIFIDGYVPERVSLSSNHDLFTLQPTKETECIFKVEDEKGVPLVGVKLSYYQGFPGQFIYHTKKAKSLVRENDSFGGAVTTSLNGVAVLKGVDENKRISIDISHDNYEPYNDVWDLDKKNVELQTIVLRLDNHISGKIKCNETVVKDATVSLYEKGRSLAIKTIDSDENGFYTIQHIVFEKDKDYYLEAHHSSFGKATMLNLKKDVKSQEIDLNLIKEISPVISSVDEIEKDNMELPVEELNILKKIVVKLPEDNFYNGLLLVDPYNDIGLPEKAVNIGQGVYSFELDRLPINKLLIFEAPGFAAIRFGPYEDINDVPNALEAQLSRGHNLKVSVVDDSNGRSIPFCLVDLNIDEETIRSLPANGNGEVLFTHLNGSYNLKANFGSYQPYNQKLEISEPKEFNIRLVKGGRLKGHLTRGQDVVKTLIMLNPSNRAASLDEKGNFDFFNIYPGEYTLSVREQFKNGSVETKYSNIIKIESEKTLDLDLDSVELNEIVELNTK